MLIRVLRCKIHRATVTDANVDYVGSISIDQDLIDAAGLIVGEMVLVADLTNGRRLETYVQTAPAGSAQICMNGAAARLVSPGDKVIIIASAWVTPDEARQIKPQIVLVDEHNRAKKH